MGIAHGPGDLLIPLVPWKGTTKGRGVQSLYVDGEVCCVALSGQSVVVESVPVGEAHGYVVFALRAEVS